MGGITGNRWKVAKLLLFLVRRIYFSPECNILCLYPVHVGSATRGPTTSATAVVFITLNVGAPLFSPRALWERHCRIHGIFPCLDATLNILDCASIRTAISDVSQLLRRKL